VATVAFTRYIKSKFYKAWRAHESGSVQSLRGQLIEDMIDFPKRLKSVDGRYAEIGAHEWRSEDCIVVSNINRFQAEDPECGLSTSFNSNEDKWSAREKATQCTSFSRTTSEPSAIYRNSDHRRSLDEVASPEKWGTRRKQPSIPLLTYSSFAEAAFAVTSGNPRDDALLLGSTWLATLIAGIESVSIGFSMLSAPEIRLFERVARSSVLDSMGNKDDDFNFVYENHQFERDFGYGKHELVGRNLGVLFRSAHQDSAGPKLSESEKAFMNIIRSGIDGNMGLTLRRKNGRLTRTFVCVKALYNQHGQFRYVMCLSVNIPVNCHIRYENGRDIADSKTNNSSGDFTETTGSAETALTSHLLAQFNSNALVDLLDLLPSQFVDDYLPIDGTVKA
jgi:PAS domain S-box-containing protein